MDHYTRRASLALGLGLAVTACGGGANGGGALLSGSPSPTPAPAPFPTPTPTATPTPAPAPTGNIGALAASKGMRFGSACAWSAQGADAGSFANPNYATLLERDCNILVPENELKWAALRPSATSFDFTRADAMLTYARAHGMEMRGHNLLWYDGQYDPAWLSTFDFGNDPRSSAQALVRTHVQTVMRHYGSSIQSYDVINEAVSPSTGNLRTNTLARQVGGDTSLLDLAFLTARQESSTAELVYNDYMDAGTPNHRQGVLALLRGFKERGIPVDTLGVQSHLGFYSSGSAKDIAQYNVDNMKPFLDQVVGMGYKLKVTELDVNDTQRQGTIEQRDADTAVLVRAWLDMMMSYTQLTDILVRGMSDRYSWLQSNLFGMRWDGQPKRPTLYDASFQAKPMRQAIIEAFAATPRKTSQPG